MDLRALFDFEERAETENTSSSLQGLLDCSTKVKQKYLFEPYFTWFFHTEDVVFLIKNITFANRMPVNGKNHSILPLSKETQQLKLCPKYLNVALICLNHQFVN